MYLIPQITSDPLQNTIVILPNGNSMNITLYYIERQLGWFITNLTYGTFVLNGIRITNNLNMLYPWKNILPFGLACISNQKREPTQLQDFSSGAASLYVLDAAEVETVTEIYQNGS